ncbi:MAG TPA: hypothetical protein PKH27_01400 [Candidatus Desulfobacillus denitrificans]|nr:hypothetical protein [Candidatus Desulfobacillus denitrificans]HNT63294.1 hypothetical protein [Candidatus Desulfobacillus denitrificans]
MIALRAPLSAGGDYQLRIAADGAAPVTVLEPRLDVRRAPY